MPRRTTTRRKPKLPTPPCSPTLGTLGRRGAARLVPPPCSTPSPPPLPDQQEEDQLIISSSEPLPPPPPLLLHLHQPECEQQQQLLPPPRRLVTSASSVAAPPGQQLPPSNGEITPPPPAVNNGSGRTTNRQPAATPKRDSPATIAAKEAPGWQMFLGFKSSTVSFTSEEVDRLRAARDESRSRVSRREESRTRAQQQQQPLLQKPSQQQQLAAGGSGAARSDQLRRDESFACRLKRTESRGRKRTENPNSDGPGDGRSGRDDGGQENADPNCSSVKKRQQLGGIVQQRSQELLGRSAGNQYPPTRISGERSARDQYTYIPPSRISGEVCARNEYIPATKISSELSARDEYIYRLPGSQVRFVLGLNIYTAYQDLI